MMCELPTLPLNAKRRFGVTLVELLIVIGILTILATLALTTVKGLLKDQKVTQASRLVKQYFEMAKIRAITNGRPVAVFLERTEITGDPAAIDQPTASNYSATRLSLGEVFPPYSGDVINATGQLWDVDMTANQSTGTTHPDVVARGGDGHADQIRFAPAAVFSAFGTPTIPGMVGVGDLIELQGSPRQFIIESIDWVDDGTGTLQPAVTFFNPPAPFNGVGTGYNQILASTGLKPPQRLLPGYATAEPEFPVATAALPGIEATTPGTSRAVEFKIFRRPTKSMVGAIAMPRGTCVDLYASGLGRSGSTADHLEATDPGGPLFTPFYVRSGHPTASGTPPGYLDANGDSIQDTLRPSSFSRIAIVFDGTGKAIGMFRDDKIVPESAAGTKLTGGFYSFPMDSVLYLLVGRTEQVQIAGAVRYSRPTVDSDKGTPLSNVLDPANSWISINPLTGNVSANPIGAVVESTGDVNNPGRVEFQAADDFAGLVSATRTFASAGVENNGE